MWLGSKVGEVTPSALEIFEGKKNPQSSIWLFTSLYRILTPALMWHVFYTYNFYEKSTGWQLEPNLLLLIWITVLGCSLLRAAAGWHRGNLLAQSSGSSLLLPSPSPGYRSRLLHGVSDKLTCELGALIRRAALCTSYPTKVQMQMQSQTSVPPQQGRGPAAGMAVRRPAASSPWQAMSGRDTLASPLHLFARLLQLRATVVL